MSDLFRRPATTRRGTPNPNYPTVNVPGYGLVQELTAEGARHSSRPKELTYDDPDTSPEGSIQQTPRRFRTRTSREESQMDKAPIFNGKPGTLDKLITYVELSFVLDKDTYIDDKEAQAAFFARQFRGSALDWLTSEAKANVAILRNYDALKAKAQAAFNPSPDAQQQHALRRITRLRQTTSVRAFYVELNSLAAEVSWNTETKRQHFINGLKPQTRQAIIAAGLHESSVPYDTVTERAAQIDDELFATQRSSMVRSRTKFRTGGNPGNATKCYTCGKFGHKAATCRTNTGTGRAIKHEY